LSGSTAAARVAQVRPGTPAARAGIRAGDVIVGIDGHRIGSSDELRSAIDARSPGDTVSITLRRSGKERTVHVTLASRPS
jgi:putative serine protease PepD